MSIQSRKNNNKYNNKNNKNKRTRKRPLQRGGAKQIVKINDLGPFVNLKENIQFFIRKNNLGFTNDLELIQIDDSIHFFTEKDADNFRNILEEFKQKGKSATEPIQLNEGYETDFTEKISKEFIKKKLIYVSPPETIYNLKLINTTGGNYTLFKFKTIKADTKVGNEADNEAEAEIASSVDTTVEVKNDKAVGNEVSDKLSKMMTEITSKITKDMSSAFHHIILEYIDIKLEMYTMNLETKEGHIHILGFSRGHHVKEFPSRRIKFTPSKNTDPASDKGDGSIFLALTVKHCNDIFQNIPYWKGSLSKWWTLQGVCSIQKACMVTDRSSPSQEINNDFFLEWSNKIIETLNVTTISKNKIAPVEDAKIEKVKADGANAYATIMNKVKGALEEAQDSDNTEEAIEAFYQTIESSPNVFLQNPQWKDIDESKRKLALKYFSEQKKKLLLEATPILKIIPKTKTNTDTDTDTDKGIKTYLTSNDYNKSDFKKLAVQFITQNPDITNKAIDILTFT